MTFDDELIGAYLDGELDEVVRRRLDDTAKRDSALRKRIEEQERVRSRLQTYFGAVLTEDVPERLTALLTAPGRGEVASIGSARSRRAPPPRWWVPAALAASLAAGFFGGQFLRFADQPPGDPLVAHGEIAQALDTQLASSQPADAAVKLGVTFRNVDGQICRTFDGAQAGYACRHEDHWRLQLLAPSSLRRAGEFAQAGEASPVVMQAAQEAMSGEPLDHQEERRAQLRGWR